MKQFSFTALLLGSILFESIALSFHGVYAATAWFMGTIFLFLPFTFPLLNLAIAGVGGFGWMMVWIFVATGTVPAASFSLHVALYGLLVAVVMYATSQKEHQTR